MSSFSVAIGTSIQIEQIKVCESNGADRSYTIRLHVNLSDHMERRGPGSKKDIT